MPVHLIGSGGRAVLDIPSTCTFHAVLRVAGEAAPSGELTDAKVHCPRKGCVSGSECVDCVHLQAYRAKPEVRMYCTVDHRDPVRYWMRPKPPATTVETRCPAADEFAAHRGVHHLLVFDRQLHLAGLACRCDLARGGEGAVEDVMSRDVFVIEPTTLLGVAATAMKRLRIGCLPVVAGPLVVGILTRRDLDRAGVPADWDTMPPT